MVADKSGLDWEELGEEVKENFDLVADYFNDLELYILRILIEYGPRPTRELWNWRCARALQNNNEKISNWDEMQAELQEIREKESDTAYYDRIREILKEQNINFPSYHTIEKTLEGLNKVGAIRKREVEGRNYNFLWRISPEFRKKWRQEREEILSEMAEEDSTVKLRQKYTQRVFDFFGIDVEDILVTKSDREGPDYVA